MVITCASSCVKLTKSEIGGVEVDSNIAQITSIVPMKSYLLIIYTNSYDSMHDSGDTAH